MLNPKSQTLNSKPSTSNPSTPAPCTPTRAGHVLQWTCAKVKGFGPLEIIEFPSVLVKCAHPPEVVSEFQV